MLAKVIGGPNSAVRIFGISVLVTIASLLVAFLYGSWDAFVLCMILGVLEVSLSFDNAVINATVLKRMSEFWQKIFLTVGILIAVFGMRLIFPLVMVWVTAGLNPVDAFSLALNPPAEGSGQQSYEEILTAAHPQIAAFGGMFLLMLFLRFIMEEQEITWLAWFERPLARIGKLDMAEVVVASVLLVVTAYFIAPVEATQTVLVSGILGMVLYLVVDGLGNLFHAEEHVENVTGGPSGLAKATGKAAFFLFLYLEVLDASFSFDGVIGAFAITADPIIIMLGLGFIGAMFVRSITVYMVRRETLDAFRYLEHGAHWAIGALAVILFVSIGWHVNEIITGLVGVLILSAAALHSYLTKDDKDDSEPTSEDVVPASVS